MRQRLVDVRRALEEVEREIKVLTEHQKRLEGFVHDREEQAESLET